MSTITAPPIPSPASRPTNSPPTSRRRKTYGLDPNIYRFSVAQYERMAELGILGPDDKVELLEGYVVLKMARNPPHDSTIQRLQRLFFRMLPGGWDLRVQLAVTLSESVPEPDFAIVRGDYRSYANRHPGPADIGLVIEVANTSLERDIEEKSQVYAESNIVAYWVIDVANGAIHQFMSPSGPGDTPSYADHAVIRSPAAVPLTLDGIAVGPVPAADLLP
jgi:hypothetical protein